MSASTPTTSGISTRSSSRLSLTSDPGTPTTPTSAGQLAQLKAQLEAQQAAYQRAEQVMKQQAEQIALFQAQLQASQPSQEEPFTAVSHRGNRSQPPQPRPAATPQLQTANKFQPLDQLTEQESVQAPEPEPMQTAPPAHVPKPPPIIVKNVANYIDLCQALRDICNGPHFTCKSRMNEILISPSTAEAYRAIVRYLKEKQREYHTYQCKEDKSYRVVIRHLHHSTPTDMIKQELSELGFVPRNISQVFHPRDKTPLPLFFIDLEPNANNQEIFKINHLLYTKIKVEEPKKQRTIVQCKRCQEYGHTKGYCNHRPNCVKCAGAHLTEQCSKQPTTPARCVLCKGLHPANYRGCPVHKELQARRRPLPVYSHPSAAVLHQQHQGPHPQTPLQFQPAPPPPVHRYSYAQAAGSGPTVQQQPSAIPSSSDPSSSQLQTLLEGVNRTMNLVLDLLTKLLPRLIQ